MSGGSRWSCPKCGRFIADKQVEQWDEADPGDYFGVRACAGATCGRCGQVEPVHRPVVTLAMEARDEREFAATVQDAWRGR